MQIVGPNDFRSGSIFVSLVSMIFSMISVASTMTLTWRMGLHDKAVDRAEEGVRVYIALLLCFKTLTLLQLAMMESYRLPGISRLDSFAIISSVPQATALWGYALHHIHVHNTYRFLLISTISLTVAIYIMILSADVGSGLSSVVYVTLGVITLFIFVSLLVCHPKPRQKKY